MNTGTLYGVGIGPGDPKLMTFRAAELIRDNEIIALPGEKAEETVAYQIAVQTVEELKQKTFLELPMPMTKVMKRRQTAWRSVCKKDRM